MTPLERAARALYARTPHVVEWDDLSQSAKNLNIADARAVLEAIREPSEGMEEAAGNRDTIGYDPPPSAVWQAMIDAALSEGG